MINKVEIKHFQIDDVSKITGLTKRTIRYYEDMELIKPVRTYSGYRLYTQDNINQIVEIKDLRLKLGLNITEIKKIIGLRSNLYSIYESEKKDTAIIKDVIFKVETLYKMIVDKEETLLKVKKNCYEHLEKLNSILKEEPEEKK